jgi:tellurite methyltransferase
MDELISRFAGVDIMLIDQLLRACVPPGARILDAGCGGGRNLGIFQRAGHEVWGSDLDASAISAVRDHFPELDAQQRAARFLHEDLAYSQLPSGHFDFVICNAVLHFARDPMHLRQMVETLKRVCRPEGRVFARLASREGVRDLVSPLPGRGRGWGRFPDGSEHYLIDEDELTVLEDELGLTRLEPLKTVSVGGYRAMATWVFRPA